MITSTELSDTLIDVRKAWRLVYGWQRRIHDLLQQVEETVQPQGLDFEEWWPDRFGRPKQSATPFYRWGTWAWDMLPGYHLAVAWADPPDRFDTHQRVRRVVVHAVADTGFRKVGGEPDPADFLAPQDARSEIRFTLWTGAAYKPWWKGAWEQIKDRPHRDEQRQEVTLDGIAFSRECAVVPMERLVSPAAVEHEVLLPIAAWLREQ